MRNQAGDHVAEEDTGTVEHEVALETNVDEGCAHECCRSMFSWKGVQAMVLPLLYFRQPTHAVLDPSAHVGPARLFSAALGLSCRFLEILVLVYWFFIYAPHYRIHEESEAVTGATRSWIGAGRLYDSQLDDFSNFCSDTRTHWYYSKYCPFNLTNLSEYSSTDRLTATSTGCEDNIRCSYPDYGVATQKRSEDELHIFTYLKDTMFREIACSTNTSACREDEQLWRLGSRCKCWKTENQFLIGVDHMTLVLKHEFDQLTKISSSNERFSKQMKTHIRKDSIKGEVLKTFEPGEDIEASVQQWLSWAGLDSLDRTNQQALQEYPPGGFIPGSRNEPSFRMTGVEIALDITYKGSIGVTLPFGLSNPVECDLVVRHRGGYHSFGSHPVWLASENDTVVIHDRYLRGINFKIRTSGVIGEASLITLFVNCATLLVYFAAVPNIVELVVYSLSRLGNMLAHAARECNFCQKQSKYKCLDNLGRFLAFVGYESNVWHMQVYQLVTLDGFHAKRLLHSMLAKMIFGSTPSVKNPSFITEKEAFQSLSCVTDDEIQLSPASPLSKPLVGIGPSSPSSPKLKRPAAHMTFDSLDDDERGLLMDWLFEFGAMDEARVLEKDVPPNERSGERSLHVNTVARLFAGSQLTLDDCMDHVNMRLSESDKLNRSISQSTRLRKDAGRSIVPQGIDAQEPSSSAGTNCGGTPHDKVLVPPSKNEKQLVPTLSEKPKVLPGQPNE